MSDVHSSLDWLVTEITSLRDGPMYRRRREVLPLPDGRCEVEGRELLNFASNDYLNLAQDPRVIDAAQKALLLGTGARASALVCGRTPFHVELEETIAAFEGTEDAVVFPTGYAANVGALRALIRPEDVIFCDRFNHASLLDGCRLSQARLRVYRPDDLSVLERELSAPIPEGSRRWIVTDSVFSMDGWLAPLSEICTLAEAHDAAVFVDEAHGTGVFGELGRGVCELTQTTDRVAVRVGTLSKAVGALGGFVAGSRDLCEWLWNHARTQMFSTALPPSVCAAASTALHALMLEPQRRTRLHELCALLRSELKAAGIEVQPQSQGPIIPIVMGEPERTLKLAQQLEERGYLVAAIRPPTVPNGTSKPAPCWRHSSAKR